MQIKTKVKYHYLPIKLATINETDISKYVGQWELLVGEGVKGPNHFQKLFGNIYKS